MVSQGHIDATQRFAWCGLVRHAGRHVSGINQSRREGNREGNWNMLQRKYRTTLSTAWATAGTRKHFGLKRWGEKQWCRVALMIYFFFLLIYWVNLLRTWIIDQGLADVEDVFTIKNNRKIKEKSKTSNTSLCLWFLGYSASSKNHTFGSKNKTNGNHDTLLLQEHLLA